MARAQQFRRRLSGKLHPHRVLQDSEQGQRRSMGASVPTSRHNSRFYGALLRRQPKSHERPELPGGAEWPECRRSVERVFDGEESAEQPWTTLQNHMVALIGLSPSAFGLTC